jgi:hypothetical protein
VTPGLWDGRSISSIRRPLLPLLSGGSVPTLHAQEAAGADGQSDGRGAWSSGYFSGIIPTALGIDRCPGAGADGADAVGIVDQKDPGIFTSLDDRIVIVPDESA